MHRSISPIQIQALIGPKQAATTLHPRPINLLLAVPVADSVAECRIQSRAACDVDNQISNGRAFLEFFIGD